MLSNICVYVSGVPPQTQVLCRIAAVSLTEESLPLHWPERRLLYSADSSLKRLVTTPKRSENAFWREPTAVKKLVLGIPCAWTQLAAPARPSRLRQACD